MKKTAKKPVNKTNKSSVQSPLRVGNCVLIRTVTMYQVGKIERITPTEVLLSGGSWVAFTNRLSETLENGTLDEVEVIPDGVIYVGKGAIVDAFNWGHPLPTASK